MGKLLVLALGAALAACERNGERDDGLAADTQAVETPEQTQRLLAPIRAASMAFVTYGDTAVRRATRDEVRRFGQAVATDHRALIAILDSVAAARGTTLGGTAPAGMLSSAILLAHAGLDELPVTDFDRAFIRAQVESHRELLDRIDHETIPAVRSSAIELLLHDTRAMVYAHLVRARQILGGPAGQPPAPPRQRAAPADTPPRPLPDTIPRPPPDTIPRPPPDTVPRPPPDTIPPGAWRS
jgi:predicted outer membrane protein